MLLDDKIMKLAKLGKRIVKWLLNEFDRCFQPFRDWVPDKYTREEEPNIIVVKLIPLPIWLDKHLVHQNDKSDINTFLNKFMLSYKNSTTININLLY